MNTKTYIFSILIFLFSVLGSGTVSAHCDSFDGPVIKDAMLALESNNASLVLKWVRPGDEQEIIDLFNKTYALRNGDQEIYQIVEKHFLETLVRLHRESEGAPYTGLKPAGSASPIVVMADHALENDDIDDLLRKLDAHLNNVIRSKFEKVEALEKNMNKDLAAGREYVKAYVEYTHTLEAIHGIIEAGPGHHDH